MLHRAAYTALGLRWRYDAIEMTPDGLAAFLDGLDGSWVGLSLTMPLKEAVLPMLSEVSAIARRTSAANTVLLHPGGRRTGENTDVHGIARALQEGGFTGGRTGVVLGAGATARSAAAALDLLGVGSLDVVARRPEAAGTVLEAAGAAAGRAVAWDAAGPDVLAADVVVSTVPGDAAASLADRVPSVPGVLLDVTYHPWPTQLAQAWLDAGGTVVPGALMLLWQAARQVELMTGRPAPVPVMRQALAASG